MLRICSWLLIGLLMAMPASAAARRGLVDINTATVDQLMGLPGIRDARAAAIVRNRPYLNKGQLLSRKVLSPGEYHQIKDRIIARQ
jgi:competence protein ComEA